MRSLAGHVIDAGGSKTIPVAATKLELQRIDDESVLKTVMTDERGLFAFENVRKGAYRLRTYFLVEGRQIAPRFDVIVKVTASGEKPRDAGLKIFLGLDCFVSEIVKR